MKTPIPGLMAAALLLAAGAAHAAVSRPIQAFVDHAQAAVQARIDRCGPDVVRGPVKITAYVEADGRLQAIRVDSADGLRSSETAIAEAVRQIRLDDVPPGLIDAKLTFYVRAGG
jgi:hypothetical protein